jgi:hypothetical protein
VFLSAPALLTELVHRDLGESEHLLAQLVRITFLVNNACDACVDNHLRANDARVKATVDGSASEVCSVACGLDYGILFRMDCPADLLMLAGLDVALIAQTPDIGTVGKASGWTVVSRGHDAPVDYDDSADLVSYAGCSFGHCVGDAHEVFIFVWSHPQAFFLVRFI